MAYNRWLAHHGVKGQKWGERNGPPYPLDSSKSDGHRLLKGDGSPQGKKKYKTSEKIAHKREVRRERTGVKDIESAKRRLRELGLNKDSIVEFELWSQDIPEKERLKWMQDMVNDVAKKAGKKSIAKLDSPEKAEKLKNARTNDKAESQNKVNSKPQKKSISERINSFKDRIVGSSKKAQEIDDWNVYRLWYK